MNKVRLKKAYKEKQLLELVGMAHDIWREHYASIISQDQIEYMLEKYQSMPAIKQAVADGYEYYIISRVGVSIGYAGVKVNEPLGKMFVSKIYLYKDYRGKGYASDTFAQLEETCRRLGMGAMWLTVNRGNSSVAAYKKIGFEIVREQVSDIGHGFVMDDFVMEKRVENI